MPTTPTGTGPICASTASSGPREREGIFSHERYPIDNAAELIALRAFLGDLAPDSVRSCAMEGAAVRCVPAGKLRALALYAWKRPAAVRGWLYSPDGSGRFRLEGLPAGKYQLAWFDPWTGAPVPGRTAAECDVKTGGALDLDAGPVLAELRAAAEPFPAKSRQDRGRDVAFKLTAEKAD